MASVLGVMNTAFKRRFKVNKNRRQRRPLKHGVNIWIPAFDNDLTEDEFDTLTAALKCKGAKYDAQRKAWYIPAGVDLCKFPDFINVNDYENDDVENGASGGVGDQEGEISPEVSRTRGTPVRVASAASGLQDTGSSEGLRGPMSNANRSMNSITFLAFRLPTHVTRWKTHNIHVQVTCVGERLKKVVNATVAAIVVVVRAPWALRGAPFVGIVGTITVGIVRIVRPRRNTVSQVISVYTWRTISEIGLRGMRSI